MKEFVEKLIERLEEEKSDWNYDYNVPINKIIEIVKDLAEEHNNGFCEWEIVSDKDIDREYKPMCSEDGFIQITGYFDYEFCPYCGKKIKVVE